MVDEVRRRPQFGQKPRPLRERHEPICVAARAAEPSEAAGQEAAAEERPELVLNEPWKAMAIAQPRGLGEETLDMLPDHRIQD